LNVVTRVRIMCVVQWHVSDTVWK